MNRNYIFLTLLMILLAFGTLVLKKDRQLKQIEPQQLLKEIIQPTRYVSTDQVAQWIIQNDPSLELIDVRSEVEFNDFSLPNALNIPLDSLLERNNMSYFGIPGTKIVFVANDDIAADRAWVLTKRLGFRSTYVMKGGLNCWMETIIDPKEPGETEPAIAFETYAFRKGAQIYFTGAKSENTEASKIKVQVRRREKTNVAAGGC